MANVISKNEPEKLKRWIIDFLVNQKKFSYANLSYFNDYDFVDSIVKGIIEEFDDYSEESLTFETVTTTLNDKIMFSECCFTIYREVENVLGEPGAVLYVRYEYEALWHSAIYFEPSFEKAKELANLLIKSEQTAVESKIGDIKFILNGINKSF